MLLLNLWRPARRPVRRIRAEREQINQLQKGRCLRDIEQAIDTLPSQIVSPTFRVNYFTEDDTKASSTVSCGGHQDMYELLLVSRRTLP
jgi:hypothetical protein